MGKIFKTIGIIGKYRDNEVIETLHHLVACLQNFKRHIIVETETAQPLKKLKLPIASKNIIGKKCDLLVVVGGDGSLLKGARAALDFNTPVVGINRGTFGFLTDIKPADIDKKINAILEGKYREEKRFMLDATITQDNQVKKLPPALNEVVISAIDTAQMINFEIFVDNVFVYSQLSDGVIAATPTGSTAYALSAGGPILHPKLDAVVLIPKFPHTLSSRPIVLDANQTIKLILSLNLRTDVSITCDGKTVATLKSGDTITIKKTRKNVKLIHPLDYNYYETLRNKLGWGRKLAKNK